MRRQKRSGTIIILLLITAILGALLYLYNSAIFERTPPKIELEKTIHWNLKTPIPLKVSDASGIKFLRVTLSDGENTIVLAKKLFEGSQKEVTLDITFPKTGFFSKKRVFDLIVETTDGSKWNFFAGNQAVQKSILHVDTRKPELYILTNSYKITKGGVGTIIFKADDENLKELYIKTNIGHTFYPTPFYKEGYYIALVAWPSDEPTFRAEVVVEDHAGNKAKSRVKFYLQGKKYRQSQIALKENFLNGKIADLIEEHYGDRIGTPVLEKFKLINESLRQTNEEVIEKFTKKVPTELLQTFSINPFYPLKNGAAVASFGDHRFYQFNKEGVSESYHLGLDLASTAQADIVASNPGTVVYAEYNGIYGKNIIISHGLGIYSLYGHCSAFTVAKGDVVNAGEVIAKTGLTGLALGDHLHFGILVQGVEVRPEEWMDASWMKDNLFKVMQDAKKIIDRK